MSGKKRKLPEEKATAKPEKKRKNLDPFVCLKCHGTLTRGSEFYKKRHWEQMHKGEDSKLSLSFIVPRDHEEARRSRNTKEEKTENNKTVLKTKEPATSDIVQKTMDDFIPDLKHTQTETAPDISDLPVIREDKNQIKLMLSELTISKSHHTKKGEVLVDRDSFKKARCLVELQHEDILVEIGNDGCKITCKACYHYMLANPDFRRYILREFLFQTFFPHPSCVELNNRSLY